MANGYESRTVCRDSKIYQKGAGNSDDERPEIIGTDIETCNGMIHTLNSVMLHKTAEQLGLPPSGATFGPTVQPVPTVPPVSQPPTQCETLGMYCDMMEEAFNKIHTSNKFLSLHFFR